MALKSFNKLVGLFVVFGLLLSCGQKVGNAEQNENASKVTEKSPNLIIVLVDDMGYEDVGFNGCPDIPTPNIDKIAGQGVKFTNGYVSYAVCGPSRAGIITGRYQDRFGFSRNPLFAPNDPSQGLPLSEETLASALRKGGYKSVALGKWHLGAHKSQHPLERGFDDFYGFLSGGHMYFPELLTLQDEFEAKSQFDGYKTKMLRNHQREEETEYVTDALSRDAVRYIEKYKDQPFFIYLAYNAPHTPMQATEKYLSRFDTIQNKKRKTYAAMVSAVDDGVGRVLDKLEELDLDENTIVCFLSDNGGAEGHNGANNGILRDGKGSFYEGGFRVPFAMKWPAKIPAGTTYDKPIIALDIFGTIIAQSQTPIKTKNSIDGVNLIPYITGENKGYPHDYLFWRGFDANKFAVRNSNGDKLLNQDGEKELYDLNADISEESNLVNASLDKTETLNTAVMQWNSKNLDPLFKGLKQNREYDNENPDRFKRPE
ncbi:MAG: sulfatase-like hydrolase/transferase [Flavobacteriaceae bacterium]